MKGSRLTEIIRETLWEKKSTTQTQTQKDSEYLHQSIFISYQSRELLLYYTDCYQTLSYWGFTKNISV